MKRLIALLFCLIPVLAMGQTTYFLKTDTTSLSTRINAVPATVRLDTIPIFAFGFGSGAATDTSACTNTAYYGAFYNKKDTLVVTSLNAVMAGDAGDTLAIQVSWDDSLGGTATVLNTTALGINSLTTGTVDASFNNAKIPPGVWVWGSSPGVVAGKKPQFLSFTISGCRIKP